MNRYNWLVAELRGLLPEYMAQKRILVGNGKTAKLFRCINPEHNDKTPSMSYHAKTHRLHCFGCGASYDLFEVIAMDYPECDSFPRQVKKACEIFGRPFPEDFGGQPKAAVSIEKRIAAAKMKVTPVGNDAVFHEQASKDYTEKVAQEFKKHGAGGTYFSARGLSSTICQKHHLYEKEGRAVLPVYMKGRCISYCMRALDDGIEPRYKNSAGAMGIFGTDYFSGEGKGGALFITESIFDALSVEECGGHAVALCGAGNVRKFLTLCAENPAAASNYTLIAAGDNDEAGQKMVSALTDGLKALGIACGKLELPTQVKDINELLVKDRNALKNLLDNTASADRYLYNRNSTANSVADLLDFSMRRASRNACPTGFRELDQVLDGGLYAGLYIIGAISSLGKTSYILQMADNIAAAGNDVLYFSLEMSKLELMAKSVSRISYQTDPSAEHRNAFTARQVLRFEEGMSAEKSLLFNSALERYKEIGQTIFMREGIADIGVKEIRANIGEHIRSRGVKPVVFVDYLQILKPTDPRATDKQNTDRSVVELKRISRDFDVPVVAVSSFNRENYRNSVTMESFKESGAVEYSSDVLLGMQFSNVGDKDFNVNQAKAKSPRAVEVVMLKNRNGIPYACIEYAYLARFSHFVEGFSSKKP